MTLYTTCGNELNYAHDQEAAKRLHDLCSGRAYDSQTEQLVTCPCEGHLRPIAEQGPVDDCGLTHSSRPCCIEEGEGGVRHG